MGHLLQIFGSLLTFLQQTFSVTRGFVENGLCEEQQFAVISWKLTLCGFLSPPVTTETD